MRDILGEMKHGGVSHFPHLPPYQARAALVSGNQLWYNGGVICMVRRADKPYEGQAMTTKRKLIPYVYQDGDRFLTTGTKHNGARLRVESRSFFVATSFEALRANVRLIREGEPRRIIHKYSK